MTADYFYFYFAIIIIEADQVVQQQKNISTICFHKYESYFLSLKKINSKKQVSSKKNFTSSDQFYIYISYYETK